MIIVISLLSVLGIISAEMYLKVLLKLIEKYGIKADVPRMVIAILFLSGYLLIAYFSMKYFEQNSLKEYGGLILIPLWNFGVYIFLHLDRAKVALGPIPSKNV